MMLSEEEWRRIECHIKRGPSDVRLDINEHGAMVVFDGGAIHPKTYLELVESLFGERKQ